MSIYESMSILTASWVAPEFQDEANRQKMGDKVRTKTKRKEENLPKNRPGAHLGGIFGVDTLNHS